ncbi:lisH domain-containing protein C1711.05-like isoform X2 [Chelonus insularis]|uniref:lisH domain-containing protein C1711.05-like isoform X2 n=1 Tax=Chelonus insularis TaxID=460826 RepID=UPI00158BD21F|nr:lisH domain-containing protein C1711.05-like isoform X2 [Chelonus insularis]
MEKSPRRSRSLNFEISDLFLGSSYPPTFNLISNSKMYSSHDSGLFKLPFSKTQKLNHSVSMDDTVDSISDTKKNIVQSMTGMFGSLKNLVSKIPNFMSNINSPLSVTVVPNEGILSPEDIIHNLTGSSESLVSGENSLGLFDRMNKLPTNSATFGNGAAQISEMFTTKYRPNPPIHKKFKNDDILVKTWNDDYTENCLKPEYMNFSSYGSPLSAVQSNQKSASKEDINFTNITDNDSPEVDTNLVDDQDINSKLVEDLEFLEKITLSYSSSSSSDSESPIKNFYHSKQSQRQNTSGKFQLRSREPSESSTDSEDSFIVFEEESQTELTCDSESSSDGDVDHDENQPSTKSKQFFQQREPVGNNCRSRRSSESSIDSEGSCVIVFKDEHDYPDFDCKTLNDEEPDNNKKSGRKKFFY